MGADGTNSLPAPQERNVKSDFNVDYTRTTNETGKLSGKGLLGRFPETSGTTEAFRKPENNVSPTGSPCMRVVYVVVVEGIPERHDDGCAVPVRRVGGARVVCRAREGGANLQRTERV